MLVATCTSLCSCGEETVTYNKKEHDEYVQKTREHAYFEGQRDAVNGDVRIRLDDSVYVWKKSPWDDGKAPLYSPDVEDSKVSPNKKSEDISYE